MEIEPGGGSSRPEPDAGAEAVLFVMVDDTRNCDDVGAHLEKICPELAGGVLVLKACRGIL